MSYNVECKLTIRYFDGTLKSKTTIPISEDLDTHDPHGVDVTAQACIYAMKGLGHSMRSIKESFDREIRVAICEEAGTE